jgi:hypothetical protein
MGRESQKTLPRDCTHLSSRVCASRVRPIGTLTMPSSGVSISRIRKIAPAAQNAHSGYATNIVPLRGARRPNVPDMIESQHTSTISKGSGSEPARCSSASDLAAKTSSASRSARTRFALRVAGGLQFRNALLEHAYEDAECDEQVVQIVKLPLRVAFCLTIVPGWPNSTGSR